MKCEKAYKWLNENDLSYDIWDKKYRYKGESFDEFLERVSGGNEELKQLIIDKKFLFGGRTLSNVRTDSKGSRSNCYSEGFVPDDTVEIMKVNTELALTYKSQGGQGVSLSHIRPKGTPVGDGEYTSDGIIPFMKMFNQTTESISQGGCIAEDELVLTDCGYKRIKDICIGDNVFTKVGYIPVNYVFDKGIKDVFEVVTDKGFKIKTTIDHKFCVDGFSTKRLSELNVGDNLNLICGDNSVSFVENELAYFLGVYFADGYVNKKQNGGNITFNKSEKLIAEKIQHIISNIGFSARLEYIDNYIRVYLTKDFLQYLSEMNLIKQHSEFIEIPKIIMEGDKNAVISFISGAIDSDGCVYETSFKYNTISEVYANQFMKLLSSIGFFPSMTVEPRKISVDGKNRKPLYSISDSFRLNQCKLHSLKLENSKCASNSRYSTPYTMVNTEITSVNHSHLKKVSRKSNIGLYTYTNLNITPVNSPIIFDKIKSITYVGESHVYDISLESEHLFNCNGIYVSNSRKGALIITLDAWHKETMDFITIKSDLNEINKANLSLEIDDEFMKIVSNDMRDKTKTIIPVTRTYGKHTTTYDVCPIEIFRKMAELSWENGEPAPLFVEQFRNYNLMQYVDAYQIETCNPCGEMPLPKYFACNLASINLSEFVTNPYTDCAEFNFIEFTRAVKIAIEALDDVIDEGAEFHALEEQRSAAKNYRNTGLGVMGLGSMLFKLGIKYGSFEACTLVYSIFRDMARSAIFKSNSIAKIKGAYPKYDEKMLESDIMRQYLSEYEIEDLYEHGLRNCSLLSIAPSGSIGTMLGVTTGCEPAYAISYKRKTESLHGDTEKFYDVYIKEAKEYMEVNKTNTLPDYFVVSEDVNWKDRVKMQSTMQKYVDTAISSTVNLKESATVEDVMELYATAWMEGCKGITVFRAGCKREGILSTKSTEKSVETVENSLQWGSVIDIDDDVVGKKRKLTTGCGTLHCTAFFDVINGDLMETYFSKGSSGGCNNFMVGLSRMISLSARAGVGIDAIIDQLKSTGTCPSYAVRRASLKDTSRGSCCPVAIGFALKDMWNEVQVDLGLTSEEICDTISVLEVLNPCPECGVELEPTGKCWECKSCGYSKCE